MTAAETAREEVQKARAVRNLRFEADQLLRACVELASPLSIQLHAKYDGVLVEPIDPQDQALLAVIELTDSIVPAREH